MGGGGSELHRAARRQPPGLQQSFGGPGVRGARRRRGLRAAAGTGDSFTFPPLDNAPARSPSEPLNLADIRNSLKSLMWRNCGVRRDADGLREAAENIDHWCRYVLARQFNDPGGWELQNMLCLARLMVQAALMREETRGCHFRLDFPNVDDEHWHRHITFNSK